MNDEAIKEKSRASKKKAIAEKPNKDAIQQAKIRRSHYLDDKQLKINISKITEFLGLLDPNTVELNYYNKPKFVEFPKELRAIKRDKQEKNYIKSTLYYSLVSENSETFINNFFEKLNGSGHCAYYSVFNFEPERGAYQNKIKNKKITNQTAKSTMVLPMDFDNISEDDYKQIKQRFNSLGLETLDVFTGHGYQMIILLNKYCYDKDILKKFTNLLAEKGFPVDEAIIDSARIMRLPYTYNCKCLDPNSKYYGKEEPILTEVVSKTTTRYNINDVFNRLNSLKSIELEVPAPKEIQKIKEVKSKIKNKVKAKVLEFIEPISLSNNKLQKLQDLYSKTGVNIAEFETVIQNILAGTRDGMRHDVLLFLMPYFRNTKGYSCEKIEDILSIWGNLCTPAIPKDEVLYQVRSLYKYKRMTAPYGKYSANLIREYGVFRLGAIQNNNNNNNKIYITNDIIKNLDKMPSKALKIYTALLLENSKNGANVFNIKDIRRIVGISSSTFGRSIEYLKRHGYIKVNKKSKRNGEKYEYNLNLELINFNKNKYGFVAVSKEILEKALDMLTTGELSTWLYISMLQGSSKQVSNINQYYIGSKLRRTNTAISNITSSLAEKGFINKTTEWLIKDIDNGIFKQYCLYDVYNITKNNIIAS